MRRSENRDVVIGQYLVDTADVIEMMMSNKNGGWFQGKSLKRTQYRLRCTRIDNDRFIIGIMD